MSTRKKIKKNIEEEKIFSDQVILDHGDFAQFTPFPGEGGKPTFTYIKVF